MAMIPNSTPLPTTANSANSAISARRRRHAHVTPLAMVWALPCSLVGALLALPLLLTGATWRRVGPAIEVRWHARRAPAGSIAARLPFAAITLGQVIVGVSAAELARLRAHEQVHVRQYLAWGPLFAVAYPLASAWATLCGRCPYRGNAFERQAYRLGGPAAAPARHA